MMHVKRTVRGTEVLLHSTCRSLVEMQLLSTSMTADRLWVGGLHNLNRDQVGELRGYLTRWLETGGFSLELAVPDESVPVPISKAKHARESTDGRKKYKKES